MRTSALRSTASSSARCSDSPTDSSGALKTHRLDRAVGESPGGTCMERSVEVFAVIVFGVIGLSHVLQPEAWVEYFVLLRSKGRPGAFVDGFLHLPLAGAIVGFHNVWSGIPVLLTLLGWALLIKGLL